jgi:hypothetical protein
MALPVPNIWAGTSVTRCDRIPGEYRNKKPRCSLAQMAPGACEADHAKRARRRVEYSLPSRRSENDWRAAIAIETLRPIAATSRENTHAPGSTSRAKPGGRHLKAFSDQVPGNGSAEFRFRRSCVSSRSGTEVAINWDSATWGGVYGPCRMRLCSAAANAQALRTKGARIQLRCQN